MRVLALDAALRRCSAAVVAEDRVLAAREIAGDRGVAALLPAIVGDVLRAAGDLLAAFEARDRTSDLTSRHWLHDIHDAALMSVAACSARRT